VAARPYLPGLAALGLPPPDLGVTSMGTKIIDLLRRAVVIAASDRVSGRGGGSTRLHAALTSVIRLGKRCPGCPGKLSTRRLLQDNRRMALSCAKCTMRQMGWDGMPSSGPASAAACRSAAMIDRGKPERCPADPDLARVVAQPACSAEYGGPEPGDARGTLAPACRKDPEALARPVMHDALPDGSWRGIHGWDGMGGV
jgi:hypothetical protein